MICGSAAMPIVATEAAETKPSDINFFNTAVGQQMRHNMLFDKLLKHMHVLSADG